MKLTQSQKDKKAAERFAKVYTFPTLVITAHEAFLAGVRYARRTRKKKK